MTCLVKERQKMNDPTVGFPIGFPFHLPGVAGGMWTLGVVHQVAGASALGVRSAGRLFCGFEVSHIEAYWSWFRFSFPYCSLWMWRIWAARFHETLHSPSSIMPLQMLCSSQSSPSTHYPQVPRAVVHLNLLLLNIKGYVTSLRDERAIFFSSICSAGPTSRLETCQELFQPCTFACYVGHDVFCFQLC